MSEHVRPGMEDCHLKGILACDTMRSEFRVHRFGSMIRLDKDSMRVKSKKRRIKYRRNFGVVNCVQNGEEEMGMEEK